MTTRIPSVPMKRLNRVAAGRIGGAVRSEVGRTLMIMAGAALLATVAVGIWQANFVEHGPPDLAGMMPPEAAMGMPPQAALGGPPPEAMSGAAEAQGAALADQAGPIVVFLAGSAQQAEQAEREADAPRRIALVAGTAEEANLAQQLVRIMQLQFGAEQVSVVDLR